MAKNNLFQSETGIPGMLIFFEPTAQIVMVGKKMIFLGGNIQDFKFIFQNKNLPMHIQEQDNANLINKSPP